MTDIVDRSDIAAVMQNYGEVWNITAGYPKDKPNQYLTAADEIQRLRALVSDLEESHADTKRLTRELDVAMHGEDGAAEQASLCDLIEPAKNMRWLLDQRDRMIKLPPEVYQALTDCEARHRTALEQIKALARAALSDTENLND